MLKNLKTKLIHFLGGYTEEELIEQGVEFVDEYTSEDCEELEYLNLVENAEGENREVERAIIKPTHPDSVPLNGFGEECPIHDFDRSLFNKYTELEISEKERALRFLNIYNKYEKSLEVISHYFGLNAHKSSYMIYKDMMLDILSNLEGLERNKLFDITTNAIMNIESSKMGSMEKRELLSLYLSLLESLKKYLLENSTNLF